MESGMAFSVSDPAQVHVAADEKDFVTKASEYIVARAETSVKEHGVFIWALSGGTTPAPVYARLQNVPSFPWEQTVFLWTDERCVPPEHPDSNYGMALRFMPNLQRGKVLRIEGESPAKQAAARYHEVLNSAIPQEHGLPVIDLVLLGVGEDGHTASLFPGTEYLASTGKNTLVHAAGTQHARVSLSLPVINNAETCVFLATGPAKEDIVREILLQRADVPARHVRPKKGTLVWIVKDMDPLDEQ